MPDTLITAAAGGCLVAAGVYFAFAVLVMPALLPDARTGVAVMRAVNRRAMRPPFMILFGGTAVLCLVVLVLGIVGRDLLAGLGAAGHLASVAITIAGNVPLNDALDRATVDGDGSWAEFAGPWSRLNLVRALVSAIGGALLLGCLPT